MTDGDNSTASVETITITTKDEQKQRAIQYWNESKLKHTELLKDRVHDDVMQHLHQGKVLPIFHTLCCPPTERLFSPNTHVSVKDPNSDMIQLSSAPVTMGECDQESELIKDLTCHRFSATTQALTVLRI